MSATLGSVILGITYKEKSKKNVERLLEEENYTELEDVRDEAHELVDDYNDIFEKTENYLDEPYQASFALLFMSQPKDAWKKLGYCEALLEYNK